MRDYLAKNTAKLLVDNIEDYTYLVKKLSFERQEEYKTFTREEVKVKIYNAFVYAFQALYGEIMKIIIMLIIAYIFNIFIPVTIVCLIFAILRTVAGGVHMDSFMKCLVSTAILILIPSYFVNKLSVVYLFNYIELFIITSITYIISYILANKYAPKDTEKNRIDDINKIKILKKKTKIYIIIISVIAIIFVLIHSQLVVLSLCLGVLLEMFTITPIGVNILLGARDIVNDKNNKAKESEI